MKATLWIQELEFPTDGRRKITLVSADKKLCELACIGTDKGTIEVEIDEKQFTSLK